MIEEESINISQHSLLCRIQGGLGKEQMEVAEYVFPKEVALCLLLC